MTGLPLKEAKDLVDAAPKFIATEVSKIEAMEIQRRLQEAGARVDLK